MDQPEASCRRVLACEGVEALEALSGTGLVEGRGAFPEVGASGDT